MQMQGQMYRENCGFEKDFGDQKHLVFVAVFSLRGPLSLHRHGSPVAGAAAPQPGEDLPCAPSLSACCQATQHHMAFTPKQIADTGHSSPALPERDLTCRPGSPEGSPVVTGGCWLCCSSSLCLPICHLGTWQGAHWVLLEGHKSHSALSHLIRAVSQSLLQPLQGLSSMEKHTWLIPHEMLSQRGAHILFPGGMCCKCPVTGRRSARGRKHISPKAGCAFRKHILHVSSCISTLAAGLGSVQLPSQKKFLSFHHRKSSSPSITERVPVLPSQKEFQSFHHRKSSSPSITERVPVLPSQKEFQSFHHRKSSSPSITERVSSPSITERVPVLPSQEEFQSFHHRKSSSPSS
ncbi:uncharacterized protein LOC128795098 isoform X2 [Vidua chalybeata]|uniref:uncharacterized protein LOC128795098 isoform X2 n=1 Tax=Vidua chalybeata TaxID=81927 RepID=UPI0023A843D5|nr:uncharacterized protein LOC128795098 isoform X2 [Vidua chalybeata]